MDVSTSTTEQLYFPFHPERKGDCVPEGLLETLKTLLDSGIYTWNPDTFVIPFPNTLPRKGAVIKLQDLLQDPDFESELHELAYDEHERSLRKLNFMQLQDIRKSAEFAVPSIRFPGQAHVWRLSLLIQKGWYNIARTAREEVAFSLRNILVWIPNRLCGKNFSIPSGFGRIFRGIVRDIPSLLWGWVEQEPKHRDLEGRVNLKKEKFLLEEIKYSNSYNPEIFSRQSNQVTTMDGEVFDFRLLNEKLAQKVATRLHIIQEMVNKEFDKKEILMQKQITEELQQLKSDELNLAQEVADRLAVKKQQMLEEAIRADKELEGISSGIANPIFEFLEANRIFRSLQKELDERRMNLMRTTTQTLERSHPILSLVPEFMYKEVKKVSDKFDEDNKYYVIERSINMARERKLIMSEYFFKRQLLFEKERAGAVRKGLEAKKIPCRTYIFRRQIWNPKNWKIHKLDNGRYYFVEYEESTVTSDRPFWRLQTYFYRTASYWNNSLFALYKNIIQGPLSFRALFSPSSFFPDMVGDFKTGTLKQGPREVQSFASRLRNLWRGIFKSRAEFEQKPDVGFLGKSVVRVVNVAWNYIIKGLIGTSLVAIFQPVLSVGNIMVSTLLAATSMIWCPITAVLVHLFSILIYDFDDPRRFSFWCRRVLPLINIILRKGVFGVIEVGGSCIAILAHLASSLLALVGCGLHTSLRWLYDFVIFYGFIKWRGRIPAADSFAARRIQGPGLSRRAFFQIEPDLALVALQVKMEEIELQVYEREVQVRINKAREDSMRHIQKIIGPLDLTLSLDHPIRTQLREREQQLMARFQELSKNRRKQFPLTVDSVPNQDRIALERRDLEKTLQRATMIVENFYKMNIFPHMPKDELEEFWHTQDLGPDDFAGLSRNLLASVFSRRFLSPLEESDKSLVLKVDHTNIHQYAEGLMDTGAIPDDLDVVNVEYPNFYNDDVLPRIQIWDAYNTAAYYSSLGISAPQVAFKFKKIRGTK